MRKTSFLFFVLLITNLLQAQAQEQLSPIYGNPSLQGFLAKNPNYQWNTRKPKTFHKSGLQDTLLLPFFDDFATSSVYPNANLWSDNKAFINTDFAVNPPTIGVATLDALDEKGNPYLNIRAGVRGGCDTLSSQAIDLSTFNIFNDIYLSFKYQCQGWSYYALNGLDSLVVQFYGSDGLWRNVCKIPGSGIRAFKDTLVHVDSPSYFHAGFRFRFINYQEYLGALGQWHLDYIYLERSRGMADTSFQDVAIAKRPETFLNNYQTVPYLHYKGNENSFNNNQTDAVYSNLENTGRTIDVMGRSITDDAGNTRGTASASGQAIGAFDTKVISFNTAFTNPGLNKDTVNFTVKEWLGISGGNYSVDNDTAWRNIEMANYYAYDDGTAETGYGIRGGSGRVAYGFNIAKDDSLRAVSVFFTQAEDTIKNSYQLTIWSEIAADGGTNTTMIYQAFVDRPRYEDSINKYHMIRLDSAIFVSGKVYIGWQQTTDFMMNVGFDRNYTINGTDTANPRLFFNTTGQWINSTVKGTLMMRPHFGAPIPDPASVSYRKNTWSFTIYPNPASDRLYIDAGKEEISEMMICTLDGRTMNIIPDRENSLDISALPQGMYVLKVLTKAGNFSSSKFIKQ